VAHDGPVASVPESSSRALPVPPFALRERVGATTFPRSAVSERLIRKAAWWDPDPEQSWLRQGRHLADLVSAQLPTDFELRGAHVLDFGCGAGRVLRHLPEVVGETGALHGVDIDGPSIAWLQANTSPPLHATCCDEKPGLPYPDGQFDLVYAMSVFTHLVEHWAGWLLELRRVLKPGGVLLATVIGRETSAALGLVSLGDAPGMYARMLGNEWQYGGPVAVHDAAWVAERWGRAFEIVSHAARVTGEPWPHDIVVARRRAGDIGEDALLAPGAGGADGEAWIAQLALLRDDAITRRALHGSQVETVLGTIAQGRASVEAHASARLAEVSERYAALELERAALETPGWAVSRPARALVRRRRPGLDGDAG
jgi:SAM-dependent methyltransferase